MAFEPISSFPVAVGLSGDEMVPVVQGGVTKRTTVGGIASFPVTSASFITAGTNAGLTGERILTQVAGETVVTDNGALSTITVGLASTITAAGPIGDATHVPAITFDAKGRLTTVSSVAITFPAAALVVGTSTITSGTTTRILYDNAGVLGEYTLTGTGTVVAMQTSPSFTTPALGTPTAGVLSSCTGYAQSALTGLGAGVSTFLGTPSSANLASAVTDETGSGALVFANTPTFVTPLLGTPTSGNLSNCTGFPAASSLTVGSSPIVSGTTTRILYDNGGLLGEYTISGSGTVVAMATSPSFTTPALGTPTAGVLSSCTGLPLTTGITGILGPANGGTGVANNASSTLTISGNFATTLTVTNTTGVTLPTTGTLATLAGSEALTNKTINGNTFTAGTYTLTGTAGKTLNFTNILTLSGTDSTTMTFPATSSTVLTTGNTATITKGYTITPNNLGNITNFTIDPSLGNYQFGTNHGAATWTAPASDCAVDILVTNDGSAGSITFSGFTVGASTGSALTTTNGNKFIISIRRINSVSTYSTYALQ